MQHRLRFMGTGDLRSLKRLKTLYKCASLLYQDSPGANWWNDLQYCLTSYLSNHGSNLLNLLFVSGSTLAPLIQHNDLDTSSIVLTTPNTSIDQSHCIWSCPLPVGDKQAKTSLTSCWLEQAVNRNWGNASSACGHSLFWSLIWILIHSDLGCQWKLSWPMCTAFSPRCKTQERGGEKGSLKMMRNSSSFQLGLGGIFCQIALAVTDFSCINFETGARLHVIRQVVALSQGLSITCNWMLI